MGRGSEAQPFRNGSIIMPKSVTKVSGHGVQGDKVTLDEAFSLSEETGNMILDGFVPTMATRLQATGEQSERLGARIRQPARRRRDRQGD